MYLCSIKAVLFDFGGVIADEGFRNGLYEIAGNNNLDPKEFAEKTTEIIHQTGYITGAGSEQSFWETLREETGIRGADEELKNIILKGFTVRAWMINIIKWLKSSNIRVAILSDQTNWLDELEAHMKIFDLFEQVFNSYHLGKSKREKSLFSDILGIMNLAPGEALFVDDTQGHVERAKEVGLHGILFKGKEDFLKNLSLHCTDLPRDFSY